MINGHNFLNTIQTPLYNYSVFPICLHCYFILYFPFYFFFSFSFPSSFAPLHCCSTSSVIQNTKECSTAITHADMTNTRSSAILFLYFLFFLKINNYNQSSIDSSKLTPTTSSSPSEFFLSSTRLEFR